MEASSSENTPSSTSTSRDSTSSSEGTRQVNLELSFEYLMSREEMRWVRVSSPQAVLMSLCLQGMVHELLSHKRGHRVKTVSDLK